MRWIRRIAIWDAQLPVNGRPPALEFPAGGPPTIKGFASRLARPAGAGGMASVLQARRTATVSDGVRRCAAGMRCRLPVTPSVLQ